MTAQTVVPAQEDGGATILEIGQQPDAWREVAGRSDEQADAFLSATRRAARPAGHPDRRRQFGVRR